MSSDFLELRVSLGFHGELTLPTARNQPTVEIIPAAASQVIAHQVHNTRSNGKGQPSKLKFVSLSCRRPTISPILRLCKKADETSASRPISRGHKMQFCPLDPDLRRTLITINQYVYLMSPKDVTCGQRRWDGGARRGAEIWRTEAVALAMFTSQ